MWLSFETASRLYDLANLAFIISLVIGVVATVTLVWMGDIKEEYLRRDIASANERAAAAELALERYKAPRELSNGQLEFLSRSLASFKGQKFCLVTYDDQPEAMALTEMIRKALRAAGWNDQGKLASLAAGTVGIYVDFNSKEPEAEHRKNAAETLADSLSRFGIPAIARDATNDPWGPQQNSQIIGIEVGSKH